MQIRKYNTIISKDMNGRTRTATLMFSDSNFRVFTPAEGFRRVLFNCKHNWAGLVDWVWLECSIHGRATCRTPNNVLDLGPSLLSCNERRCLGIPIEHIVWQFDTLSLLYQRLQHTTANHVCTSPATVMFAVGSDLCLLAYNCVILSNLHCCNDP